MVHRSDAGRGHVDLARIGFSEGNEFRNRLGRNRRIDLHHLGHAEDAGDRRDVPEKYEAELVVERRLIVFAETTSRSVCPSAGDRTTASMARFPPAPGRCSTTNG